ncbi:phosphonate degradation operons associated HDIG domain protein [compost metagenome]
MTFNRAQFTEQLADLFARRGNQPYGEAISQTQHALQCATLAERSGCNESLVIAALLHDVGHLYEAPDEVEQYDLRHEERGAELLRNVLPDAVWQPIRLHVAAKRYFCAVDPAYHAALSPASRHSLELQGGPFSNREAEAFLRAPYAQEALTLRRLDDLGKDPAMQTPPLEHFHPLLERLLEV